VLAQAGGDLVGPHADTAVGAMDGDATIAANTQHIAQTEGFELGA
jgi:hypothetical protein